MATGRGLLGEIWLEGKTASTPSSNMLSLHKANGVNKVQHTNSSGTVTRILDAADYATALDIDTGTSTTAVPTVESLVEANHVRGAYWGHWTAMYDFSTGSTPSGVGTHNLIRPSASAYEATQYVAIPDNTFITRARLYVMTTFTSGGAATIALGVDTDDTAGILAAEPIATFSAGTWVGLIPDDTSANYTSITTGARNLIITVATASITAGKFMLWVETLTTN